METSTSFAVIDLKTESQVTATAESQQRLGALSVSLQESRNAFFFIIVGSQ